MNDKTTYMTVDYSMNSISENGYITGYASVFDHRDKQSDVILCGAFKCAVNQPERIRFLNSHIPEHVIGKIEYLEEDDYGLYIEARLDLSTEAGKNAYNVLKQNPNVGLSIGYNVNDCVLDYESGIRLIRDITLYEISIVEYPANELAKVTNVSI